MGKKSDDKSSSDKLAELASKTLKSKSASQTAKRLAGSVLSQAKSGPSKKR